MLTLHYVKTFSVLLISNLWRLYETGATSFPGSGHQTSLEEENRRLKREVERLQQERDILKKAVSIFSRESR